MNDYTELIGKIKDKDDFIEFMNFFTISIKNEDVKEYLISMQSWIEDMEGFYKNTNRNVLNMIDWDFIATILYVGTIYE